MKKTWYWTIVVGIFSSYLVITSAIAKSTIQIIDQAGQTVPNAVVELTIKGTLPLVNDVNQVYIMDQVQKAFKPKVLIVPKGNLVQFPNSDDIRHHVYSFSPAKPFELKLYAGKPKSPIRFEQQGVVVLGCNIHDAMIGYIYVTDKPNTFITDSEGKFEVKLTLEELTSLSVWHANATNGVDFKQVFTAEEYKVNGQEITLTIDVDSPELRDSFEDQFSNVQ